ncbi:lysosomal beta glucosidase-like protein [Trifolium pratense]|uniref:beta-glucosidase n=1 Tax=Trifolium pratense TaxID=57577 RepID=A0A2K3L693_TRIPR|nr:lysosomal beta glucosidase-like protein [Trifolium pratense]
MGNWSISSIHGLFSLAGLMVSRAFHTALLHFGFCPNLAKIDALVAVWLPGTEGQGVADVLYSDFGFTGKLARTWFSTVTSSQ